MVCWTSVQCPYNEEIFSYAGEMSAFEMPRLLMRVQAGIKRAQKAVGSFSCLCFILKIKEIGTIWQDFYRQKTNKAGAGYLR